jgi:hypothetical protein
MNTVKYALVAAVTAIAISHPVAQPIRRPLGRLSEVVVSKVSEFLSGGTTSETDDRADEAR